MKRNPIYFLITIAAVVFISSQMNWVDKLAGEKSSDSSPRDKSPRDASGMSIEDCVGQLLIIQVSGNKVDPAMEACVSELKPGGVIYYEWANDLNGPDQVRSLSRGLQSCCAQNSMPPLWICIDQEGGRVCRLRRSGYTHFPSAMALSHAQDLELTRLVGLAIGQELSYSGINVNFAPVVDIWNESEATVIGNRCLGITPSEVTQEAEAWLQGLQSTGVMGCLKHFPGHGAAKIDTHHDLAVVDLSLERLHSMELSPYRELVKESMGVMTAHILVPSIDPLNISTKSAATLNDLLKQQLGFKGILFSDSLVMAAASPRLEDLVETCVDSLMAGCDVLVLGGKALVGKQTHELNYTDLLKIKADLVRRVNQEPSLQVRVREAVQKVLNYKQTSGGLGGDDWDRQAHVRLAERVAERAVVWKGNSCQLSALDNRVSLACSPLLVGEMSGLLAAQGINWSARSWTEVSQCLDNDMEEGTLVLASYEAWKDPVQLHLIEQATRKGWKIVLLALGTNRDLDVLDLPVTMQISSPDSYCLKRAIALLLGDKQVGK